MSATYFKKFCVSALCAFISILAIGQDAEAKFAIEKTKGLSVIDGQKFSNLQNREINLGVLNVLQAIPFYPTLRNYMDLPAQGDSYASVRVFARALFRPFDPQNPVEIEPARQPNKLSYYLTPAILGEVVAESLLEDKATNLNIEDKKQLELRKKALAVRLFVNKPHFRERLAEPYERFCNNPNNQELVFDPRIRDQICTGTKPKIDIEAVDGNVLYSYLNTNFTKNINQVLSIFSGEPDLIKIRMMLSWLWWSANDKQDIWEFYEAVETRLQKQNVKFMPKNKQQWLDAYWSVNDIAKVKVSRDMASYPQLIVQKFIGDYPQQDLIKYSSNVTVEDISQPDCCSTSLRNFIMIMYADPSSDPSNPTYDLEKLKNLGAADDVLEFFTAYNTMKSQQLGQLHTEWAIIQYNLDIPRWGKNFEADPEPGSFLNSLMALLFKNSKTKPSSWQALVTAIDPGATAVLGNDNSITFNTAMGQFKWTLHDRHSDVSYIPSQGNRNLWGPLGIKNMIETTLPKAQDLASNKNMRWIELAMLYGSMPANNELMKHLLSNRNFLYCLSLDDDTQLESIITDINASDEDTLDAMLDIGSMFPGNLLRQIANNTHDKTKLEKIASHMTSFVIDTDLGSEWIDPGTDSRNLESLIEAMGKTISSHTKLSNLKISSINSYRHLSESSDWGKRNLEAFQLFLKNLKSNKSITNLSITYSMPPEATQTTRDAKAHPADTAFAPLLVDYFENNTVIQHLRLSNQYPVDDNLFKAIAKLPLRTLDLSAVLMDDTQAASLATAFKGHSTLQNLNLSNNLISDEGVESIDSILLENNKVLKVLDLSDNKKIGEAGVKALISRVGLNGSLDKVNVKNVGWTELSPDIDNQDGVLLSPRQIRSPMDGGFRYTINFVPRRNYSSVAYRGPIHYTRPAYQFSGYSPNITYGRPLFIFTENNDQLNALPNSLVRMQPSQPVAFGESGLIPWNLPNFPKTWTRSNWHYFKRILRLVP